MKFRFINVLGSVMSYMSFEFILNRYLKVVYKPRRPAGQRVHDRDPVRDGRRLTGRVRPAVRRADRHGGPRARNPLHPPRPHAHAGRRLRRQRDHTRPRAPLRRPERPQHTPPRLRRPGHVLPARGRQHLGRGHRPHPDRGRPPPQRAGSQASGGRGSGDGEHRPHHQLDAADRGGLRPVRRRGEAGAPVRPHLEPHRRAPDRPARHSLHDRGGSFPGRDPGDDIRWPAPPPKRSCRRAAACWSSRNR